MVESTEVGKSVREKGSGMLETSDSGSKLLEASVDVEEASEVGVGVAVGPSVSSELRSEASDESRD